MLREHLNLIRKALLVSDLILVVLGLKLSLYLQVYFNLYNAPPAISNNLFLAAIIIWGVILWHNKSCFEFRLKSAYEIIKATTSAHLKASGLFLVYLFIAGSASINRIQTLAFLLSGLVGLNISRLLVNAFLEYCRRHGYNYQQVIIVGRGDAAKKFADKIINNAQWGLKISGFIDCAKNEETKIGGRLYSYRDIPYIGNLDDIPDLIKTQQVDWVVFAVEADELKKINSTVITCQEMGSRVAVIADFFPAKHTRILTAEFLSSPMIIFDTGKKINIAFILKNVVDRLAAAISLVLVSPLLFITALLIRIKSGKSVLFKQERCGINGKKFKLYKFRTMVHDADKLKTELQTQNEMDGPAFKIAKDPRVTGIGRFLRKTSIDELPQLFNVLKGDMSLVGPRPPLAAEVKNYDLWQRRKLSMKPGITCLWQVSGRNNISFEQWMKMDLEYIDNWSLWLDIKILAKTIPAVLSGEGAS